MKALLLCMAFLAGQMVTLQQRPVIHLPPNRSSISVEYRGKLLELINAPSTVSLPAWPSRSEAGREAWSIDIRNMGPARVTVAGKPHFSLLLPVGETVHIVWNGAEYVVR